MTMHRDLKLDKYNINKNRYRELKYFCLQYPDFKKRTDKKALHYCKLIENAAENAAPEWACDLLKNVTGGVPYEYMPTYCGRRQFYESRRKFFYILSRK